MGFRHEHAAALIGFSPRESAASWASLRFLSREAIAPPSPASAQSDHPGGRRGVTDPRRKRLPRRRASSAADQRANGDSRGPAVGALRVLCPCTHRGGARRDATCVWRMSGRDHHGGGSPALRSTRYFCNRRFGLCPTVRCLLLLVVRSSTDLRRGRRFRFHVVSCLLATPSAANTARLRTCVWSPERSRAGERRADGSDHQSLTIVGALMEQRALVEARCGVTPQAVRPTRTPLDIGAAAHPQGGPRAPGEQRPCVCLVTSEHVRELVIPLGPYANDLRRELLKLRAELGHEDLQLHVPNVVEIAVDTPGR